MRDNCLNKYASTGEARVARKLIKAALDAGYTVSVCNGEEWTVKRSTNANEIIDALATTGHDRLRMRDRGADVVGSFWLIYDNDPSGEELIADHTDNPDCEALCAAAYGRATVSHPDWLDTAN